MGTGKTEFMSVHLIPGRCCQEAGPKAESWVLDQMVSAEDECVCVFALGIVDGNATCTVNIRGTRV
jgi:hypothetical protein